MPVAKINRVMLLRDLYCLNTQRGQSAEFCNTERMALCSLNGSENERSEETTVQVSPACWVLEVHLKVGTD